MILSSVSDVAFYTYESWLIARQQNIKLYLACLALYVVLMVYFSL